MNNVLTFLILLISVTSIQAYKYPATTLKNDSLQVDILLPDTVQGYYRSTRFDWSGIIAQVSFDKHTYFKEWIETNYGMDIHSPTNPASATGTAEEFRTPLGYEEAKAGDEFVKIGVGILERASDEPYHWDYPYKIVNTGKWEVEQSSDRISFTQDLETDFGYAYRYTKTIILHEKSTRISLNHSIKNTGIKKIETNSYCHNFFQFDHEYIGRDYKLTFSDSLLPKSDFGSNARFTYNSLSIINSLEDSSIIQGEVDFVESKKYTLSNLKTSTSVTIDYDVLPGFYYIYIWKEAYCPEPMVFIDIEPEESFDWNFTYIYNKKK